MRLTRMFRPSLLVFPLLLSAPVPGFATVAETDATGSCESVHTASVTSVVDGSHPFPAGSLPAVAEALGKHVSPAYHIEPQASARSGDETQFKSSNPRHQLDYRFRRSGVEIRPSEPTGDGWVAGVALTGFGFAGSVKPVKQLGVAAANHTRLNYRYAGAVEEWFINSPFGLEHGFTLNARPGCSGNDNNNLVLELELAEGLKPQLEEGDRAATFVTADGKPVLSYSGLKAWDATGRDLPAKMVVGEKTLGLHVDVAGAEYPITVDPLFATESLLVSSQPKADGDFGRSLAVDGPWLVIGALLEDSGPAPVLPEDPIPPQGGAVYVYERQADGSYSEYQRLTAADAVSLDNFGSSVAIRGNTIIIGASEHDVSGLTNAGAAYTFELHATGCSAGCWQPAVKLTASTPVAGAAFGSAVAIDNDTLIVGAKAEQSAHLFERIEGAWTPAGQLGPSAGLVDTFFGIDVAVSGDYVAVGAGQENFYSGAVYLFNRSLAPGWGLEDKIPGSAMLSQFGASVDLKGNTLVVGAPGTLGSNVGSARVYRRDAAGQWDASPAVVLQPLQSDNATADAAAGDKFGTSVRMGGGLSGADYIVVGASGNDDSGGESGSAYVYQSQGEGGWLQVRKLVASDAAALDRFGNSVATYGEVAMVGAQDKAISSVASGAVYTYRDNTDTDGDGLSDQVEQLICLETGGEICPDPGLDDTDDDGVSDAEEIAYGGGTGGYSSADLDPGNADSDADGVSDGDELLVGTDPLNTADRPVFGDINGDGHVDVVDVLLATRMALGLLSWAPEQLVRGNVAPLVGGVPSPADNVIGADDVLVIQRWALLN